MDDVANADWPLIARQIIEKDAAFSLITIDRKDAGGDDEEVSGEVDPWRMPELAEKGPAWNGGYYNINERRHYY